MIRISCINLFIWIALSLFNKWIWNFRLAQLFLIQIIIIIIFALYRYIIRFDNLFQILILITAINLWILFQLYKFLKSALFQNNAIFFELIYLINIFIIFLLNKYLSTFYNFFILHWYPRRAILILFADTILEYFFWA